LECILIINNSVQVVAKDPSGWWDGICDGKQGFFPSNFVELCENPNPQFGTTTPTQQPAQVQQQQQQQQQAVRDNYFVSLRCAFGNANYAPCGASFYVD
jgi:hypothetical protein